MYTKIHVNGKEQPIDISELEFYCNCPKCGKEIHIDAFWGLVTDEDFNPYTTAIYCDQCNEKLCEERLTETVDSVNQHISYFQETAEYLNDLVGIDVAQKTELLDSLENVGEVLRRVCYLNEDTE